MELWIRSQDKEQLRKIVDLKYQKGTIEDDNCEVIIGTTQYDEWEILGIYKTKERALEVLDEIQKLLMPQVTLKNIDSSVEQSVQNLVHIVNRTYETISPLNTYVYEMPKE